jgi:hypothetical protein
MSCSSRRALLRATRPATLATSGRSRVRVCSQDVAHAGQLPLDVAVSAGKVAEAQGVDIDEVEVGERVDDVLTDGPACRNRRQLLVHRVDRGDHRAVVCVNSTATGGGVAEMLHVLLPYVRGIGIDTRWLVIEGDERFFAITKRLHNHLYGTGGDGGELGAAEHEHYEAVLRDNAALAAMVMPGDVVLLHHPQPAGLAATMRERGARVVWRCHVSTDTTNEHTDVGWDFLRRYIEPPLVDAYVFTRRAFAPPWTRDAILHEIPPSIDPFSPKNLELSPEETRRSSLPSASCPVAGERPSTRAPMARDGASSGAPISYGRDHRPIRTSRWWSRSRGGIG